MSTEKHLPLVKSNCKNTFTLKAKLLNFKNKLKKFKIKLHFDPKVGSCLLLPSLFHTSSPLALSILTILAF